MKHTLVHVHSGSSIPEYLLESIHQTVLINTNIDIYIIIPKCFIDDFESKLHQIEFGLHSNDNDSSVKVNILAIEDLGNTRYLPIADNIAKFRDGFWSHTINRFYILEAFYNKYKIPFFHIENDVMMYIPFELIYENTCAPNTLLENVPWMVQDSPTRVIPSIMYFPKESIIKLAEYLFENINIINFKNDMDLLGAFESKNHFPIIPFGNDSKIIYDGAAIGQYLGGIDSRNMDWGNCPINAFYKTRKFINETCNIKYNGYKFYTKNTFMNKNNIITTIPIINNGQSSCLIANLHIHSKQLYMFSSIFNVKPHDLISGDRVLSLCDVVITTREICAFHKNYELHFRGQVIAVANFNNINTQLLTDTLNSIPKNVVRIFIYTHILEAFQNNIFNLLPKSKKYILYTGNSDHVFDSKYTPLLNSPLIKHVYAQNLNTCHQKATILPIGIANSMWNHGDLVGIYNVMSSTYLLKKKNAVYVNINVGTFAYRQILLDEFSKQFPISTNKPFKEYLLEMSECMFSLACRGNGIDTHRFWESLYLGVIPIIINNKFTNCNEFVKNARTLNVPFYEITSETFQENYVDIFTRELYIKLIHVQQSSCQNLPQLQLKYYS